jgi:hypothetical protein
MLKTPILFIVFNRIDTAREVLASIRGARPERLFIAADGPRPTKDGEAEKCRAVRDYVLAAIDWPCSVQTLFHDENLGCGKAVSGAISWFFNEVEEGIILEDDCVPSASFFPYCEQLLDRYRQDERVMHIAGHNPLGSARAGPFSYYFARNQHCWGWASWRRAWARYSFQIEDLDLFVSGGAIERLFEGRQAREYWLSIFEKMRRLEIDTWDYQWTYAIFKCGGFCINPAKNLVSNIGFRADGTHTLDSDSMFSNNRRYELRALRHPTSVEIDPRMIRRINDLAFDLDESPLSRLGKKIGRKARKLARIALARGLQKNE